MEDRVDDAEDRVEVDDAEDRLADDEDEDRLLPDEPADREAVCQRFPPAFDGRVMPAVGRPSSRSET